MSKPMPADQLSQYHQLDFAELYRKHMQAVGFKPKPAQLWDKKAAMMQKTALKPSSYIDGFLAAIDFAGVETALDVGCGPGNLAVRVATKVKQLYCLDYSSKMLECLMDNARQLKLSNISPIWLDKETDWGKQVARTDIVIASRSGLDADLAASLIKLSSQAKKTVYFSHLVGGHFDCLELSALVGQSRPAFPDYIYAVNILYQLGYQPRLSYLKSAGRLADCSDLEDFLQRMRLQYTDLTAEQIKQLSAWYQYNHLDFTTDRFAMRWALLSWDLA